LSCTDPTVAVIGREPNVVDAAVVAAIRDHICIQALGTDFSPTIDSYLSIRTVSAERLDTHDFDYERVAVRISHSFHKNTAEAAVPVVSLAWTGNCLGAVRWLVDKEDNIIVSGTNENIIVSGTNRINGTARATAMA
jgi:hypothetical protein